MLDGLMRWLGYGLCHQLPERSFIAGGVQLPVCARDTGIYLGFVISLVVIGLLHRRSRPTGFPTGGTWLVMTCMAGLMAWDGVTSYAGLRATTNDLRLFSGLAMGYAMAVIVVPIVNDELWRTANSERVLSGARRLVLWSVSLVPAFLIVRYGGPLLGAGYSIVSALSIVATLVAVNLIVVAMFPAFDRRMESWRDALLAVGVALVIALIEIWAAGMLRTALISLLS